MKCVALTRCHQSNQVYANNVQVGVSLDKMVDVLQRNVRVSINISILSVIAKSVRELTHSQMLMVLDVAK